MSNLYVIESRVDGALNLTYPQPESFFGRAAITGISEDAMAKRILTAKPDAIMRGDSVSVWPALIYPSWVARRKY
jgi:hypothetical protein